MCPEKDAGAGKQMTGRRTVYEIYWEILVYCKSPRSFTAIINRCDLNSKTGQEYLEFLTGKGYLATVADEGKTRYTSTSSAGEYIALFSSLYQNLFDSSPGFRL
jgi:predicted transcriptional regulator